MTTGNLIQIATEIMKSALGSRSAREFVEARDSFQAATDEVVRWYAREDGDAEFTDVYGDPLDVRSSEFRRYVEKRLEHLVEQDAGDPDPAGESGGPDGRRVLAVHATYIEPTSETCVLVGPEGTVWDTPHVGEPFILAAREPGERIRAALFIRELLRMGWVPYGLPLDHRARVAPFGGSVLQDCSWVPYWEAPPPKDEDGVEAHPRPRLAVVALSK